MQPAIPPNIARRQARSGLVAFALAVASAGYPAIASTNQVQCWSGDMILGGEPVRATVWIDHTRAEAIWDIPELTEYGTIFAIAPTTSAQLQLAAGTGRNEIRVTLSPGGERLTGQWQRGPMKGELSLSACSAPPPPRAKRETVTIENGNVRLAATLMLPAGDGPFPAVAWTHGSGNVTRETRNYSRWAELLAREGVASLLYDKRGHGDSTGDESIATLDVLATDLIAGVEHLAARSDIDAKRIGVGGLSQGGWIAPLAATRSDRIAFVIVESASGVDAGDQDLYIFRKQLEQRGASTSQIDELAGLRRALFTFYKTGEGRVALENGLKQIQNEPWYVQAGFPPLPLQRPGEDKRRKMFRFGIDPPSVWRQVRVPVLAVWGSEDVLVPPIESKRIIETALAETGNENATLQIFNGATHTLLQPKSPGDPWQRVRVCEDWPTLLVDWIKRNVVESDEN